MSKRRRSGDKPISWLPIDSRLLFPFFAPTHVRGVARVFLGIEIVLSLLVVCGALILTVLHFASQ